MLPATGRLQVCCTLTPALPSLALFSKHARCHASAWQVSSHGRVKASTGFVSRGSLKCSGYYRVNVNGQYYYVHRLVAATFLGPPPSNSCWQVNHLDLDRCNNHVSNLQYVTQAENARHAWAANSRRPFVGKLSKSVLWRVYGDVSWSWCSSQAEAVRMLGVTRECVSRSYCGMAAGCPGTDALYEFKSAVMSPPQLLAADEAWRTARYPGDDHEIADLMVSSHGRIWSSSSRHNYIARGSLTAAGYYVVRKACRQFSVHRLVAATFLGQPPSLDLQVNHKDLDRGNNHVDNLEYVTLSQNARHALSQRGRARRPGLPVQARMREAGSPWLQFPSLKAAAEKTGVDSNLISRLCRGRAASFASCGWEFRFVVEELLPGEEWRPLVLEGARAPTCKGHPTAAPRL